MRVLRRLQIPFDAVEFKQVPDLPVAVPIFLFQLNSDIKSLSCMILTTTDR